MIVASEEAARELLEVVPVIMKDIRSEMRTRRSPDLTVPQFRTLAFVDRNEGASLSAVANHMGLTLPSTSKLVDGLIARGMLTREDNVADRRRVKLGVTNHGLVILETSRRGTLNYLADKIASLSADDREVVVKAMNAMRSVFISSIQTQAPGK
jgi:MarR family transcriptional regulator for hemolysin